MFEIVLDFTLSDTLQLLRKKVVERAIAFNLGYCFKYRLAVAMVFFSSTKVSKKIKVHALRVL
ncbi:TPA: hypothetical protein ACGOYV_002009 [Streptococcus suis]